MTFTRFIKRPVLSTVISIFIVILGFIGLVSLPIEQYPDIAPPTVVVYTTYPGADAETVRNSVIVPLEESINGVEGMDYITSTASSGSANITVMFRQGMNADMCAVNVQNRVSQALALLPSEVTQIGVTVLKRQTSQVIMYTLTSVDGRYDDEFLTNYANINIIPALKRIEGVGDVQSPGMKTYSMRIWLKPDVMKQYNLMPTDISGVLAEQNIEAAPGTFGEQSDVAYEYSMRYTGRLKTPEEFGNIIIRSDANGQTLKLKEVADIELGGLQYNVSMKNNNLPSVMGMVQQIAGSNANQIASDVKKELEAIAAAEAAEAGDLRIRGIDRRAALGAVELRHAERILHLLLRKGGKVGQRATLIADHPSGGNIIPEPAATVWAAITPGSGTLLNHVIHLLTAANDGR